MSAPITTPVWVLTTALAQALDPIAPVAPDGLPAYGWLVSRPGLDQALLTGALAGLIIAQAQTPLSAAGWLGAGAAEGTIALRCLALTDDDAQALLAEATQALGDGVTLPAFPHAGGGQGLAGYRVSLAYTGELVIPPLGGRHTAACTYRAHIRRLP